MTLTKDFKKSKFCIDNSCVEVALKDDHIVVRNAMQPEQNPLLFSEQAWHAFIEGVKVGEFDLSSHLR